tara:strand:- start:1668 stop:2669 length:1002 start_codon:yes stop_codon:yes gene_type:complete
MPNIEHYVNLLTEEFYIKHYVEDRMSYHKIKDMLMKQGNDISVSTLHKYAKKHRIGRSRSEAKRNREANPMDYTISYMTESFIEAVDGFLLGDGNIGDDKRNEIEIARAKCGVEHKEFSEYLINVFSRHNPIVCLIKDKSMKSGLRWDGRTASHPDFYKQYKRWYHKNIDGKYLKQPPNDVRITPKSVMMWYLGDGSLVSENNTIMVRLSTDGFDTERVEFLAKKLNSIGILCHRNNDNRIQIKAKGIPAFFDFIGRKSPVKCYDYKFDLPEWRFEAKRMRQVADELNVDYQRLAYFVKIGKIGCYRASGKGRPRFMEKHVSQAKELMKQGEL